MDKITKEIRVKFLEEDMFLYDWISSKFSSNSSFLKDLARKEYAKEQVEIYGNCDFIGAPIASHELAKVPVKEKTIEFKEMNFDIDDL